jgi:hypothetical protein
MELSFSLAYLQNIISLLAQLVKRVMLIFVGSLNIRALVTVTNRRADNSRPVSFTVST